MTYSIFRVFQGRKQPFSQASDEPIRGELLSVERLEQQAEALAAGHSVPIEPDAGRPLVPRLRENAEILKRAYKAIASLAEAEHPITPAAEWLLDNFHIVEEQVREIVDDLPIGFYRKLPKLTNGPLANYPRVFAVAWELVAHTDSGFDLDRLTRFIAAYQRVQPLTIGELWAIAITLRITLVENLRRLTEDLVLRLSAYQDANAVADRVVGARTKDPEPAENVIRGLGDNPLSKPFAVQLSQRLRDQDQSVIPVLDWLDRRLKAEGATQDEIVREEHHIQGALNVTVRNVITSMRLVSAIDWPEFVESVSVVDAVLRARSDFGSMDFPTRDLYRKEIEALARGSGLSEIEVARRVAAMAAAELETAEDAGRRRDPGYFLISRGRPDFERALGYRAPMSQWPARASAAIGPAFYLGLIGAGTLAIMAVAIAGLAGLSDNPLPALIFGLLAVVPASDLAVALVNQAVISRFGPAILPALELRDGVPESLRTLVGMPVLLTSLDEIEAVTERLEVHFLSSAEPQFTYALLSDWLDSDVERGPADETLLAAAIAGIDRLNRRYGPAATGKRFYLLHRRRVWNSGQGKWMGWERKRGKLHELNRLLRGAADTNFISVDGEPLRMPPGIRYVITLDADTKLPRGAARRLVGKMAHPLNLPRIDPEQSRVIEGHGILQPRVTPSLPMSRGGSLFQRAFSGASGLDPYAFAVSDIYQDLFGEGSYVGKGIYDVDCFEAALHGRIPENTVLSHDLLEGIFTRAALASDVELVEEFPSRYDVAAARQHRWTRGDWQLLPWLVGGGGVRKSPGPGAKIPRAKIPLIGRWKILDNLRRSFSAPAALLALLCGWLAPVPLAVYWTIFVLGTIVLPLLVPIARALIPRRVGISTRNHFRALRDDLVLASVQSGFLITFLAHQALLTLDAVLRTLFRLFVAKRRLLEWTTAAQAAAVRPTRRVFLRQLAGSIVFACAAAAIIVSFGNGAWPVAAPFLVLWASSPALARSASRYAEPAGDTPISASERRMLRSVARQTWRFFEVFITADNNMLPPDNFQEDPQPVIATRTSPTNIGLYLLCVVVARDFGWVTTTHMIDRVEQTLATLAKMERYRGHFYNWYATGDLRPLDPKYISSVDSGNLAGHLIALGNACRFSVRSPIAAAWAAGIEDAIDLAIEHLDAIRPAKSDIGADELRADLTHIRRAAANAPAGLIALHVSLSDLTERCDKAVETAKRILDHTGEDATAEALFWICAVQGRVAQELRELDILAPWAGHLARAEISSTLVPQDANPSIAGMADFCAQITRSVEQETGSGQIRDRNCLIQALGAASAACSALTARLDAAADKAHALALAMEFGFLFDESRNLLSIGFQVDDGRLDGNDYDLLGSEARLASFVAIAKDDIPPKHWFRLGRTLTPVGKGSSLISWSGSMFEYLMPSLIMHAPAGSLLEGTNRQVVRRQISYGAELGVPWGISESQYNARDLDFNYQYSGFGVPDLGYKRGLADNIVIAPYATGLAAMVDPGAAARNYRRLEQEGARGRYGWYEALDYTPARLPEGSRVAVIRAYMAHHQAMSIVAIANALQHGDIRDRFHAEPIVQATELLLQERMPRNVPVARPPSRSTGSVAIHQLYPEMQRRFNSPHSRVPRTHLLSNGRYSVMMTGAGSGYSRWRGLDVTRWREDATLDNWGGYVFLRDMRTGDLWSTGYQPSGVEPERYEVAFSEDRVEITREDGAITTSLVVVVSPEDDAEVRRITVTNDGSRVREVELTSYAEIALAPHQDDRAHQAFSKLFVETEFLPAFGAILAKRRPRKAGDPEYWAAHLIVVDGQTLGDVQFETDRGRFLGRGQALRNPAAVIDGWPLSNTSGAVLDPIFSLRQRVRLPRGASATIAFWTMAADSRAAILGLVDKHHDAMAYDRASTLAWTQAQVQLHHLGIGPEEAHLYQRLANRIIYSDATLRPPSDLLKRGAARASTLWANGISGDLPIMLLRIDDFGDIDVVRESLRAFEYWRMKQLSVDLVILNEKPASYVQDLQNMIDTLVRTSSAGQTAGNVRGGVFTLRADLVARDVLALMQFAARIMILARRGSLAEQIRRLQDIKPPIAPALSRRQAAPAILDAMQPRAELEFFNGFGGFARNGREYVTILEQGRWTPAPWINVIANRGFGFHVSTEGGGFTWSVNSQQNQITPWSNDPVRDPPGEAIYIRDDDSGDLWTPTALPIREASPYVIRHGQGYSRFEHTAHDIALELVQYVPVDDPIKISRLKITNRASRPRRLSVTAYVEWVLGTTRGGAAPFIITDVDPATGAICARNPWNNDFGERVAFVDLRGRQTAWTGDRTEFLGRNGGLDRPAALIAGTPLSKAVGAGFDPCAALQTQVALAGNETTEIVVLLGQVATAADAEALILKYRRADLDAVLAAATGQWTAMLDTVQVKTPDRAMDIMLNGWLPYQTLACRVWARAGFYQASGAYGFRDQLQDVMALCVSRPDIAREHIVRAAGRQFPEGDVQHWWLAETGRGIRTRISDDAVWLAHVAMHYVHVTGDLGVLDEQIPFIEGPMLRPDQHDNFFEPSASGQTATLFEHCARGLDYTLAVGAHGLPLMGTGDWNDGMNQVGAGGKGESVWLGWFLFGALTDFAHFATTRGETRRAAEWMLHSAKLKDALEQSWDGDWYKRAWFDDGSPLGSVLNSECRIDSIAQSWSVISGGADRARASRAMAAVEKYLVRRDDSLILLFAPPFENSDPNPGYIQGYPKGVRENGGQYSHGATWSVLAFATLGDGDRAAELYGIMNPINHSSSRAAIHRYRVEPYVACGDLYSMPPQVGRGGWTWYTGSAGWMYRVAMEGILGFKPQGGTLVLDPCIPRSWPGFEIIFHYRSATYDIKVENPRGVCRGVARVELDGQPVPDASAGLPLGDDGKTHAVRIVLG